MNSKEIVKKAIKMQNPPKVPLFYTNMFQERSDLSFVSLAAPRDFVPDVPGRTEWGFIWHSLNLTIGQAEDRPLEESWDLFDDYKSPDPKHTDRYMYVDQTIALTPDKYIVGHIGITGFNLATFIRGFANFLEDLYIEPEKADKLLDMVFSFEEEEIKEFCKHDIDAISFFDDWGTQNTLMINPEKWREDFKPRYKKQFDLVHSLGKDVFFHCCGQIIDIIPDLIEIGADILNLNQPDLFGIENLGRLYSGKVCFNLPVDHQTVALSGTREEIFDYVKRLNDNIGNHNGGFIGNIEEYSICGMTEERYNNIVEAFESLNRR